MPLAISLRPGQDVFVGGRRFVLTKVHDEVSFDIMDEEAKVLHQITDKRSIEVLPEVLMSAGISHQPTSARVVIDAPRNVSIWRGDKGVR